MQNWRATIIIQRHQDQRSGLPDDSFEVWGNGGIFPNRTYSRQHEAELEVTARSAYYCALGIEHGVERWGLV